MDLTTIIQTSRGKEETDQSVKQFTRHCYRRISSLCFAWAKRHGAAAENPIDRGAYGKIEVPEGTDKAGGERIVPIQPNLRAWFLAVPEGKRKGTVYFSRHFSARPTPPCANKTRACPTQGHRTSARDHGSNPPA